MIVGFLMLGVAAGLVSGGTALLMGHALWIAVLAYIGGGMLGFGLGIALALRADRQGTQDPD